MSTSRRGPLRFRGQQEEQKNNDLINLEQQPVSRHKRGKGSYHNMKLFSVPETFFSAHWVPGCWVVISLACLSLVTSLVHVIHTTLPKPVNLDSSFLTQDDSPRFIAARAQDYLNSLIKMGPRPVGSYENERYARDFLRNAIQKIKNESNPALNILTADQVVSGSFLINQKPVGYASFYDGVQNIVVRLSSSGRSNTSAVLLNCHYDTVPGSPGASDDAFHCAVMLELLRTLSHSTKPLLHDIIFLFNGAEESGLQASHGFITKHKWAKDVKTFVNLEGCGAGGKEVLFQTGPKSPLLVQMYGESAPHPYGSVLGEELFQSGVIPSDTDFRIFRDFGHLPGYDFANIDNGFVYHTRFDNGHLVFPGSYQHTGDNILALVLALANSSHLQLVNSTGQSMVYFDFIGMVFFYYTHMSATLFNSAVALLSLCTILSHLLKKRRDARLSLTNLASSFGFAVLGTLCGWIFAMIYIYLLALFLNAINLTQSWYNSFFYQFSLYYCSTILFCLLGPFLIFHRLEKLSTLQKSEMISLGTQFILTILLLVGTIFGVRSSYLLLILVLSPTLVNVALVFVKKYSARTWIILQLVHTTIPIMMAIYHAILAMTVLVPITNRSGAGLNVELVIGLLSAATCIITVCFLVPLSFFTRHVSVVAVLVLTHLIGVLVLFSLRPFPFYEWGTGESGVLQRVPLWHVERTIHNEHGIPRYADSGYWMLNMDPSSPYHLKNVVTELNSAQKASEFCESELFCALPLYSPRVSNFLTTSSWIPGPKPFKDTIIHLKTKVDQITPSTRRVTFTLSGPHQMSFMFSPVPGVVAKSWSLEAQLEAYSKFKDRPAYFVFYQRGLEGPSWTFHIDFEVTGKVDSDRFATIALAGSHIDADNFSSDFKHFIGKFPSWAFVSPRSSEVKIWEL